MYLGQLYVLFVIFINEGPGLALHDVNTQGTFSLWQAGYGTGTLSRHPIAKQPITPGRLSLCLYPLASEHPRLRTIPNQTKREAVEDARSQLGLGLIGFNTRWYRVHAQLINLTERRRRTQKVDRRRMPEVSMSMAMSEKMSLGELVI